MVYLDTSLLVAVLTKEEHTPRAQEWLAKQPAGTLYISDWVITEFSSALALKLRTQQFEAHHRANALSMFNALSETSFIVLDVARRDYHTAALFTDHHDTGLRAGDALHLAVANHHGLQLCALDATLVDAGSNLGVRTQLI